MKQLHPGDAIEAQIIAVTGDCIFLDLNAKSEGILDRAELNDADGNCTVKEGDRITAYFTGEKNGEMRFTTRLSGDNAGGDLLEQAWKNGIPVEGKVEKEIKGGYEVTIAGKRAFCPYSQMGGRQKDSPETYTGRVMTFKIQEYKENGRNLLVSNRAILEEEHARQVDVLKTQLKPGMTVTGTVESLQPFGAFVMVNGFRALLPVSEISRSRVTDISEVLAPGQEIQAEILSTDWEHEKVSLSMKKLTADPWDTAAQKYPAGSKHTGSIARIAEFGLFVTLEPGIDGLVHISELQGENRNMNLRAVYKTGTKMDVVVKEINSADRRISLKPATSSEQDTAARKYMETQDDSETYNPFAALLNRNNKK